MKKIHKHKLEIIQLVREFNSSGAGSWEWAYFLCKKCGKVIKKEVEKE